MRRFAISGLVLLLSGCGFGTFLSDTTPFGGAANPPIGSSENLQRVRTQTTTVTPLQPEAGNVWPGPPPPEPTLADIQRQTNPLPPPILNPAVPPGSSTPPNLQQPLLPAPVPGAVPNADRGSAPALSSHAAGGTVQTPRGPAAITGGTSKYQTTAPLPGAAAGSILVPNGNGTSTLIGPDGSVTTVPTPK
jgi:hypothetical protein